MPATSGKLCTVTGKLDAPDNHPSIGLRHIGKGHEQAGPCPSCRPIGGCRQVRQILAKRTQLTSSASRLRLHVDGNNDTASCERVQGHRRPWTHTPCVTDINEDESMDAHFAPDVSPQRLAAGAYIALPTHACRTSTTASTCT